MYGIFTYLYHNFLPNVGKYTSPMDPMGIGISRPISPFFLVNMKRLHSANQMYLCVWHMIFDRCYVSTPGLHNGYVSDGTQDARCSRPFFLGAQLC